MQIILARQLRDLEQIRWTRLDPAIGQAQLFSQCGIVHGFMGRKRPTGPLASETSEWHSVRQVHGVAFAMANAATTAVICDSSVRTPADGIYTTTKGQSLAVKTADCLPLLLAAPQRSLAMAVHAGWRGLTAGIIAKAIEQARTLGIVPAELLVATGPAISQAAFEVGREVVTAIFGDTLGLNELQGALVIAKGKDDRWHVDLGMAAALHLLNLGVPPTQIEIARNCTYSEAEDWHSFRREGQGFGSNWSWVKA